MPSFGQVIRKIRDEEKLSQMKFAEKIRVHQVTLANYELDKRKPTIDTIKQIAKATNRSFSITVSEDGEIGFGLDG